MITHDDHNDGSTSPYYPRIVLCVPGPWDDRNDLENRLRSGAFRLEGNSIRSADGAETFDAEVRGPDIRMKAAFQAAACRLRPSLTPADFQAVYGHRQVIYVLSPPFGRASAAAAASRMVELGRALVEVGGFAVKCDSSGIAHSGARWRELDERLRAGGGAAATRAATSGERARAWNPLFDAFVRLPIVSEADDLYSTGMHLLGCPDGVLSLRDIPEGNLRAGTRVLEEFLRSLRIDTAPGSTALNPVFKGAGLEQRFQSFSEPHADTPEDDFYWNRWGLFRLRRAVEGG